MKIKHKILIVVIYTMGFVICELFLKVKILIDGGSLFAIGMLVFLGLYLILHMGLFGGSITLNHPKDSINDLIKSFKRRS